MFFKSFVSKMSGKMRDAASQGGYQRDNRQEGEITIESNRPKVSGEQNAKRGEYIEYEEVD